MLRSFGLQRNMGTICLSGGWSMRNLSMAVILMVGLLAGPGYGEVDLWVESSAASIPVGGTATIRLLAGGVHTGVQSLGGRVVPSSSDILANSNLWFNSYDFDGTSTPFTINGAQLEPNGDCAVGAWQGYPVNTSLGYVVPVTVLTYSVTGLAPGTVTLSWHDNIPGMYMAVITHDTAGNEGGIGVSTATITVTPEPATLSLLALGGLLLARRRRG